MVPRSFLKRWRSRRRDAMPHAVPIELNGPQRQRMKLTDAIQALDIDAVNACLAAGQEPVFGTLTLAAAFGNAEIIRALQMAGARADASTLCKAAECGHVEAIMVLIRGGIAPDTCIGRGRVTPLMYAAASGQVAAMETLVSMGARVQQEDASGRTALDAAKKFGQPEALAWLLACMPPSE